MSAIELTPIEEIQKIIPRQITNEFEQIKTDNIDAKSVAYITLYKSLIPNLDNVHDLGSSTHRYANLYTVNAFVGDIILDNNFRITEGDKVGFEKDTIAIKNDRNEVIAKLDKDGNLYIKGGVRKLHSLYD